MITLTTNGQKAMEALWQAEQDSIPCPAIRHYIGEQNIEEAYRIQKAISQLKKEQGGQILGHKIGLTSTAIQTQLGVDQPDFGVLWAHTQIANNESHPIKNIMQAKAEVEVAFVLNKDITDVEIPLNELASYIAYATPSIEVVGSRIENWDIKIADTIADNASASHWVIGEQKITLDQIKLSKCRMTMKQNNKLVSDGIGANCMGSPMIAFQWLVNTLVSRGEPLKAGQIILTGALGKMVNVQAGDSIDGWIEGLGEVHVAFE